MSKMENEDHSISKYLIWIRERKKKLLSIAFIIGILLIITIPSIIFLNINKITDKNDGIWINNDLELSQKADRGSGTKQDPYIIEHKTLKTDNSAIVIGNTTKWLVIQHCNVTSINKHGIVIFNSTNVVVKNNFIFNVKLAGVLIHTSVNSTVSENTILDSKTTGIHLTNNAERNMIRDNTILRSNASGIFLYNYCFDNDILNNTIEQGNPTISAIPNCGITISKGSHDNRIVENCVRFNRGYGMYFSNGNKNLVSKNWIEGSGYDGIMIYQSTLNIINENAIRSNSNNGVWLWKSNENTFSANTIYNNLYWGMWIYECSGYVQSTILSMNTISDNYFGNVRIGDLGH